MKKVLFFLCTLGLLVLHSCNKGELPVDNSFRYVELESIENDVFSKDRKVKVLFRAVDFDGKGVSGLEVEDFNVFENEGLIDREGKLTISKDSIPFMLKTVLLLDRTSSIEGFVPQIKAAAKTMIDRMIPGQMMAIYTFDARTNLEQSFTADKGELKAAIDRIPEQDLINSTNLYGAIEEMEHLWEQEYSLYNIEEGNLILFTDGRHNASPNTTLEDALRAIEGKNRYVAALESVDLDENALKLIAETPDHYFKADNIDGLEKMFINIQDDIQKSSQSIYYMFYQSPITDPTPYENSLKIELKQNNNKTETGIIETTFNSAGFGL